MSKRKETSQRSILYHFLRVLFGYRTRNAMEQTRPRPVLPPPPTTDDPEDWAEYENNCYQAWPNYWKDQGQPWRTDPEIDTKRQHLLNKLRASYKGYPFKDIKPKLTRADIEWLLAVHDNGLGLVDWRDHYQRDRKGLDLRGADLRNANLEILPLARMLGSNEGPVILGGPESKVHLEGASLKGAHLEGAYLMGAYLAHADLGGAHLEGADLLRAHLEGANLGSAHLEGADLLRAHLEGANLRGAFFDTTTKLNNVTLGNSKMGFASLADIHWGDVNLSVIDWGQVKMLGDERLARQAKEDNGKKEIEGKRIDRYRETRLDKFRLAVRANRQLATILRDRGLSEEANHFAYRAQLLQRAVWRYQRRWLKYAFSWFLFFLAGYGYRPGRSIVAYFVIILGFMGLYLLNAHFVTPHLRWDEALVLSVSSFHGRGFFSQGITLGDTYARLAAFEAIIGLLIEISFIATFTQRYFGK